MHTKFQTAALDLTSACERQISALRDLITVVDLIRKLEHRMTPGVSEMATQLCTQVTLGITVAPTTVRNFAASLRNFEVELKR